MYFMEGKTISELMINEQIRDKEVRVIGENGEQLGIMSSKEAQALADEAGVDLVKIAPTAQPPVCRIVDYGKFKYEQMKRRWLALGENGGVLVSAAIAAREKAVMREARNRGYRFIVLRENGFPPLYKPAGESFDACSSGTLLQISPWEYHMNRCTISRNQCLQLNRLAELIADPDYP